MWLFVSNSHAFQAKVTFFTARHLAHLIESSSKANKDTMKKMKHIKIHFDSHRKCGSVCSNPLCGNRLKFVQSIALYFQTKGLKYLLQNDYSHTC